MYTEVIVLKKTESITYRTDIELKNILKNNLSKKVLSTSLLFSLLYSL